MENVNLKKNDNRKSKMNYVQNQIQKQMNHVENLSWKIRCGKNESCGKYDRAKLIVEHQMGERINHVECSH